MDQNAFGSQESLAAHKIGLTDYEEKDYKQALECERRALADAPGCPLVLWDCAGEPYPIRAAERARPGAVGGLLVLNCWACV